MTGPPRRRMLPGMHGVERPSHDGRGSLSCLLVVGVLAGAAMLVRLAPGVAYPPHRHAGVEELHLLDGELWIDDRKLHPGDYNRAEPGTGDGLVWSETGCTCVLVTSFHDLLL